MIHSFVKDVGTWKKMTHKKYKARIAEIYKLFKFPTTAEVVADVGCGARAGIFSQFQYPTMYAVDPGWNDYIESKVHCVPDKVLKIVSMSHALQLPQKCDFIITVNAIDHSGEIKENLRQVMSNLKVGGSLYLHTHMRLPNQLDELHRMILTEEIIDDALSQHKFLFKKVYKTDPLFPPAKQKVKTRPTYVAVVKKMERT